MATSAAAYVESGDTGPDLQGVSAAIHQADARQHFGERRGWQKLRPAVLGLSDCSPAAGTSSFGNESKRNNKPQRGYPEYN